jgi:hypothetical protein
LLDQIFASEELLPLGQDNHRQVPKVDSIVDFQRTLNSIGDDPGARTKEIAPDHAPVIASFELSDE